MDIPFDVVRDIQIEYMDVEDILSICKTNKLFASICRDNELWIYLIQRDFKYKYNGENAKDEYFYAKHIHHISDISESDVDDAIRREGLYLKQHSLRKRLYEKHIKFYGYEKVGNKYKMMHEFRGLPITDHINSKLDLVVLPAIFQVKNHKKLTISEKLAQEIFDFYK